MGTVNNATRPDDEKLAEWYCCGSCLSLLPQTCSFFFVLDCSKTERVVSVCVRKFGLMGGDYAFMAMSRHKRKVGCDDELTVKSGSNAS